MTVALGGDGADELFLGYPNFLVQRFAGAMALIPSAIGRRSLEHMVDALPGNDAYMNRRFLTAQLAQGFGAEPARQSVLWMAPFGPNRMAALWRSFGDSPTKRFSTACSAKSTAARRKPAMSAPIERLAYQFLTTYLSDDILSKTDRASMFNSLEVRAPFISRAVAEYACRLPTRLKLRGREKKYILKRLACRHLPERIAYSKSTALPCRSGA